MCRAHWDDGDKRTLVQLTEDRRYRGADIEMIVQGEWAIVGFSDAEVHNALAVFGHDAHVQLTGFSRDYNEIEGLFVVPVMLVDSHEGNGSFTADQARRRDDSLLPQVTACLREGSSLRHHTEGTDITGRFR